MGARTARQQSFTNFKTNCRAPSKRNALCPLTHKGGSTSASVY